MNEIEKMLKKYRNVKKNETSDRTAECPSDEELYHFCFEDIKDGPLKKKFMEHIISCNHCAPIVKIILDDKINSCQSYLDTKKKLYPLPEEIDWDNIKTIEIYKNNKPLIKKEYNSEVGKMEFEIDEPNSYSLRLNTGQVIWRREIDKEEIFLTPSEEEEAMKYGMAADTSEKDEFTITGFQESVWNKRLSVTLVKRLLRGKLIFLFLYDKSNI